MDKKFKQDVLNGIEYFENRTEDLKSANSQMMREIERLTSLNADLENRFKDMDTRYQYLAEENDELKVKLDELTKEKMRVEEQAMDQWQGRVKVEEMYTEMKRDADHEMRNIRQELKAANQKKAAPVPEKRGTQKTRSLDANAMELLRKVSSLQDQLTKLQMEKATGQEVNRKLDKELSDYKVMYKDKTRELDAQYKRFLSLKKSFNDLTDEHEKLKTVFRGRGIPNNTSGSGNSTWPSNKVRLGGSEIETVRLVDISKVNGSVGACAPPSYLPASQKASKPSRSKVMTHKRNTSDGLAPIATDQNLPPVTTVAKWSTWTLTRDVMANNLNMYFLWPKLCCLVRCWGLRV